MVYYMVYMKRVLRRVILVLFIGLARLALRLHRPTVIAVTGSVGKTTTKDMIVALLRQNGVSVVGSHNSYNSDFGVPLSIFGLTTGMGNPLIWLYNLCSACVKTIIGLPRYIVLEVGLEEPGDISGIASWLAPDVSVLTRLAEYPVHRENFPDTESLYREKVSLLAATKPGGCVVYNAEDPIQQPYIDALPRTVSFSGFNSDTVKVVETEVHYDAGAPTGVDATILLDGKREVVFIPGTIGTGVVQSLIAAVVAVRCLPVGISNSLIAQAALSRRPTPGRMHILPGRNGSVIIDDSYNASAVAMRDALDTLASLRAEKRIAVLGVMAQIGPDSEEVHQSLGAYARQVADQVFVVGDAPYGEGETMHYCESHADAAARCAELSGSGVVFLCKGSQVARLERVVAQLLARGGDSKDYLVRQEAYWDSI